MYSFIKIDRLAECKWEAFEIYSDVCKKLKLGVSDMHLNVSEMYLNVSDIHLKTALKYLCIEIFDFFYWLI